nr:LamB/YcsF family protein [Arthrobacter sp. 24S4-2]
MTTDTPVRVLLNSDMGEGLGLHEFGNDDALMRIIDVANVACGYHAGDPDVMNRTVALAAEHGVAVGPTPVFRTWWDSDAAAWSLALARSNRSSCTRPGP